MAPHNGCLPLSPSSPSTSSTMEDKIADLLGQVHYEFDRAQRVEAELHVLHAQEHADKKVQSQHDAVAARLFISHLAGDPVLGSE
eukprot:CAMPEP_0179306224 /NCGR_PEP_ID=MMETSP0797-20121207/50021_1 /TAXON_ID=47934 /ORGANISM="Dinophysis acuminata, Strain DAEP01" /LENGTH=84 /DNA_ID=CAMNT_0021015881 /DNA_START=303 /DNA_END=557 /DNA_ORIENTATION=+